MSEKIEKVNLANKFGLFHDHWHPRIAAEINDMQVKLAKLLGEFTWHTHDDEDEMFLVVQGNLTLRWRGNGSQNDNGSNGSDPGDRRDENSGSGVHEVVVGEGEFIVIPHGVEHQPYAAEEVQVVLFEPKGTLNTGNVENERTVAQLEWI